MRLWFGGDYNPEQWSSSVWDEDLRLMTEAGVTVVTLGVFSWAQLEPEDGRFEFAWLDEVIERLHAAGIGVDLATATASPPAWLVHAHPEILPMTREGTTLWPGSRQHYSASSPVYRRYAARLVRAIAERYGTHPAVVAWHVGNEFGNDNARDYGEAAAQSFRQWLQRRYGTVERLNEVWGTAFWSQRYNSFDEVLPPRATPTFGNPAQLLDFERFSSDEHLACFLAEAAVLRELAPSIPITTNFMGFFRGVDYWKWAEHVDFVSDDCYPDPLDPASHLDAAMARDLMRSLGRGRPWMLMEQSPSAVNWRAVNARKEPGQMRALSYQALARGADGIMFFQWRQSVRGAEKFHSAMLPYQGTQHRIWREVAELGAELGHLAAVAGTAVEPARVAIAFSWDSWWSLEQAATPTRVDYLGGIRRWYRALHRRGVLTDFVSPESELSGYELVIVPSLFVASDDALRRLGDYAAAGGTLLVTYQTGVTDEEARLTPGGCLGPLAELLGIRVEEFAPRERYAEVLAITGAEAVLASPGGASVTRRRIGDGTGWYVAAELDETRLARILDEALDDAGVRAAETTDPDVELVRRGDFAFAINHGRRAATIPPLGDALLGSTRLEPYGVAVFRTGPAGRD